MRTLFRTLVAWSVLGFVVAGAQDYDLQLTQIRAEGRGVPQEISPELEPLRKELSKVAYKRITFVKLDKQSAALGETATFVLAEAGLSLRVRSQPGSKADMAHVEVQLVQKVGEESKTVFDLHLELKLGGTSLLSKELESQQGALLLGLCVRQK